MKFWMALAACVLGLQAQEVRLGSPVADFQVADLNGAPYPFAALKGETTVIVFLATRCPVSNAYNQRMEALYKDYSARGVKFIFVNANYNEPSSEVASHAKQAGFTFPIYRDPGNVADLFNAQVTPETYVIDKQGVLRYHGSIDDSQNEARVKKQSLRAALDEVIAGKPVTVAQTKAFGCSVKRAHHGASE
jgi:thiol-disulfide isomerase/thioredoxin